MEFKTLRNIENSFRQIRLYALVFAVLCIAITGFSLWKSYQFAQEQRQKIYVLDNGKSLMLALSQDAAINRPVEAREHVRRFHLADKSAFDYYKDLTEKGYFSRIISGNVQQRIEVDSVVCNFDTYPYAVRTYGNQFIIRSSNVTKRNLVTSCYLVNSVRSDNNPQGFNIEKFAVVENRDIEVIQR